MQQYEIPAKPMAPNGYEQDRWDHTAMRRRMIQGKYEDDLEHELARHLPMDRRESWGPPDLSSNVLENVTRQLSMLYHATPTVTHPDYDVSPLFGRTGIVTKAGLWPMMQRVQQMALGLRECIVRIDAPANAGLQYRLVTPDFVYAEAHADAPDVPVYYQELRLRFNPNKGKGEWIADCLDIRDPINPSFALHKINSDGSKGEDVTEEYLGRPKFEGADYPFRDNDNKPFLPLEIYRAEKTGQLFNPYDQSALAFGSLTSGVLFSFFTHCLKDSSWPQRYTVGLQVQGLTQQDQSLASRRATVTTDPSSILMFANDPDLSGQAMIGQFQAGCDPLHLLESISKYEVRVSTAAGISGDILRQSGDPRSGYAISVSRSGQREMSKRYAIVFRATDESLIGKSALMANKFLGLQPQAPQDGYRVVYAQIPLSPEEMKAQREDVIQKLSAGLISPVDAIQMLNPDLDVDGAKAELIRIRRERAEFL
tara:strand:- start:3028 stop:4473 length:1446 start_codon:yes stop_codon:yes gene_type:complete